MSYNRENVKIPRVSQAKGYDELHKAKNTAVKALENFMYKVISYVSGNSTSISRMETEFRDLKRDRVQQNLELSVKKSR